MLKIKIIITISILYRSLILCQGKEKILSDMEKEYLAYKISTIQKQCDPNMLDANKGVDGIYVFDRD